MSDFAFYEIAVGSGVIALSPMPGRNGDFGRDLRAIIAWRPDLVVSLVEQAELDAKGAGGLSAALAQARVDWVHLPMVDFGTPSADDGRDWDDAIANAVKRLSEGARILGGAEPKIGAHGKPVLFLHPKDFIGTLVELEQV